MSEAPTVSYETDGPLAIVTIERPAARNAVNRATAQVLAGAFRHFDSDASLSVAILTGRGISGEEAERIGLVNRVVAPGDALAAAKQLTHELARLPQAALRSDRLSAIEQWGLGWDAAVWNEFRHGIATVESGETETGARRFAAGAGRHGDPAPE